MYNWLSDVTRTSELCVVLTFIRFGFKLKCEYYRRLLERAFECVSVCQKDGKSGVGLAAITCIKCTNFHSPWFFILLISCFCLFKSECTERLKNCVHILIKKGIPSYFLFYFLFFGRVHPVVFINLKGNKIILVSGFSQTQLYCCESVEITDKMQPCNRIYYSKIYCRLNMFQAAYRSSSGAPKCICSLWFIYPCGDRPLSRLGGNQFLPSLDNGLSLHGYINQRLQIQFWSSWWWAICRLKHVEPSINFGIINSITSLHLVGYFYWFILRCTDPWILNLYCCVWLKLETSLLSFSKPS
jgi:hypothetical protein